MKNLSIYHGYLYKLEGCNKKKTIEDTHFGLAVHHLFFSSSMFDKFNSVIIMQSMHRYTHVCVYIYI